MIKSASDYHQHTSYDRHAMGGHGLDWANQPVVYKNYPGLEARALPRELDWPEDKLSQIVPTKPSESPCPPIDSNQIARIFLLTYSITARTRHGGEDFYYRCVPSAGALYPCEIYVVLEGLDDLDAGLYHYMVRDHALNRLSSWAPNDYMVDSIEHGDGQNRFAALTFFITAIFFRSSWKYRDRAYRYHLLDSGHLAENLSLALKALHFPFRVDYDFDDGNVNTMLGLDDKREVCLAIVRVWDRDREAVQGKARLSAEAPKGLADSSRVAGKEIDYPAIRAIHEITSKIQNIPREDPEIHLHLGVQQGNGIEIPKPAQWPEVMSYTQAVWMRRSKRNFVSRRLEQDSFGAMLSLLSDDRESGRSKSIYESSVCTGLLIGDIEGFDPGFYLLNPEEKSIEMVNSGSLMNEMAHVCLDQQWLFNAAIHFLFLTNLDTLEKTWGPRGYRYAMLSAGRLGQKIYLGATAMGLGCCGIGAFYDQEAAQLLGLNPSSKLLYLVAAGPVKKL
jgi:SagB-type dehydrogenase family enzyme